MNINLNNAAPESCEPAQNTHGAATLDETSVAHIDTSAEGPSGTQSSETIALHVDTEDSQANLAPAPDNYGNTSVAISGANLVEANSDPVSQSVALDNETSGNPAVDVSASLPMQGVAGSAAATIPSADVDESSSTVAARPMLQQFGLTKLTYAELRQLSDESRNAALEGRRHELKVLIESCIEKAGALGYSEAEVVRRLEALYTHRSPQQGPTRTSTRANGNLDRTGQRPRVGVTYRNSDTGSEWRKARPQGTAPKAFLELVQAGQTWAELEAQSRPTQQT